MSRNSGRSRSKDPFDPWFRIGTTDVNTTSLLTALLVVTSMFVTLSIGAQSNLALIPPLFLEGRVWQIVTWPFVNRFGFFTVLSFFFFWYFATAVERDLGRIRMLRFLAAMTLGIAIVALALSLMFSGEPVVAGLDNISTIILLLFIAEHPGARFFFNIPGWVIAAVIVLLNLFGALSQGLPYVILFFSSLLIGALVAKSFGMLVMYDQIPSMAAMRTPRRTKAKPAAGGTVKQGPWAAPVNPQKAAAESRLDQLLDKISASGMDSLSSGERDELMKLRDQLRG